MNRNYLKPSAYIRKIQAVVARVIMSADIPLKTSINIDGMKLLFVANSFIEYSLRAKRSFSREPLTMRWLREIVDPQDVVYDIGANVGPYSLYAGAVAKSQGEGSLGTVYAFEPAFFNFASLCRNIEINDLNNFVLAFPTAFGAEPTDSIFFLKSTEAGSALHGVGASVSEGIEFPAQFRQGVNVTSLDNFVRNPALRFPNHIKIDVDGSEGNVIDGATRVLRDRRLRSILIEINSELSQGRIEDRMHKSGFSECSSEQWKETAVFNKLYLRRS
jgi:FkbM family methyltransferase